MKILAFAASTSSRSINKKLVTYAVSLLPDVEVEILDLNDYELPLFSADREDHLGQPQLAKDFLAKIGSCDSLIISFAEHNGLYSAAYKNLFDWCSRITRKVFQNKPMVLLSTSEGFRGGSRVMEIAKASIPRFAGKIKATLSIPKFYDNFDLEKNRLINTELDQKLKFALDSLR